MSFRWQWLGSEDPLVTSGTMTIWFSARMVELTLPTSTVAHILANAIERELKEARREGALELAESIRGVIYEVTGDTR